MTTPKNSISIEDVYSHLRNKFVHIGYLDKSIIQKFTDRVLTFLTKINKNSYKNSNNVEIVISEQVVEYPLIINNLIGNNLNILDFGGFESMLPLQLSAIGHRVTVLDQRKYPFIHPNITVCSNDIFNIDFKTNDLFDVIISVSTIEHLGLGHYGDVIIDEADKIAINALWRQLAQSGKMMVTLPAGKPTTQRGYRVYNENRIREIFPQDTSLAIRWFSKNGRHGAWTEVLSKDIDSIVYEQPFGQCPVDAVAFVICEKK